MDAEAVPRQLPPPPLRPGPAIEAVRVGTLLLPVRLFLAVGWLRAGVEKAVSRAWWRGDTVRAFVDAQHAAALPFFRPAMDSVVAPLATPVAAVVGGTQIGIGLLILSGRAVRPALWCGVVMNVTFMLAGRVNPSVFYLVMEAVLLYAVSSGALGHRPRVPTRWSWLAAGVFAGAAAVMVPFVRTLQPAKVIEDPAIVLALLGVIMAATTARRWLDRREQGRGDVGPAPVHSMRPWPPPLARTGREEARIPQRAAATR